MNKKIFFTLGTLLLFSGEIFAPLNVLAEEQLSSNTPENITSNSATSSNQPLVANQSPLLNSENLAVEQKELSSPYGSTQTYAVENTVEVTVDTTSQLSPGATMGITATLNLTSQSHIKSGDKITLGGIDNTLFNFSTFSYYSGLNYGTYSYNSDLGELYFTFTRDIVNEGDSQLLLHWFITSNPPPI